MPLTKRSAPFIPKTQLDYLQDDLYGILGVLPEASPMEIKQAYFTKALSCHPNSPRFVADQKSSSLWHRPKTSENFIAIAVAYEVLKDPHLRRLYDDQYEPPRKYKRARTIVGAVLVILWAVVLRQLLSTIWWLLLLPVLPVVLLSLAAHLDAKKKATTWNNKNKFAQTMHANKELMSPTTQKMSEMEKQEFVARAATPPPSVDKQDWPETQQDKTDDPEAPLPMDLASLDAMLDDLLLNGPDEQHNGSDNNRATKEHSSPVPICLDGVNPTQNGKHNTTSTTLTPPPLRGLPNSTTCQSTAPISPRDITFNNEIRLRPTTSSNLTVNPIQQRDTTLASNAAVGGVPSPSSIAGKALTSRLQRFKKELTEWKTEVSSHHSQIEEELLRLKEQLTHMHTEK
eukprot:TRINITY_DN112270_c0_g1_i1.p1 TRINITY_DN112270_c0_g1~~TRINITY_DN112270_c0_g1_i1.p1  ORF type:complete len:400 (-),score=45.82 TRINITY_DN112270_c0_g1_i1:342-1541(-)